MTAWMTIDGAPRDGTLIDLWINGERYPDCFWQQAEEDIDREAHWRQRYTESGTSYCLDPDKELPTHWMARPLGPNGEDPGPRVIEWRWG